MKIVCLDGYALNPGDLSWEPFGVLGQFVCHDRTPQPLIVPRAGDADAILTNKTPLSAETIGQLPRLRYIGVLATGYNIVDVTAAKVRGIIVTNVPTYGTDSVAQFTFALLLELCHRVGLHADLVCDGAWSSNPDFCFWRTPQVELAGKTMGIVGLGRIGERVAQIATAFGMSVIFHDVRVLDSPRLAATRSSPPGERRGARSLAPPQVGVPVGLDDLFRESDVVSLHVPLTEQTRGLVNDRRLSLMKPTAFLINTSRGPVVDEAALWRALDAGRIAGAALDVLGVEPPPTNHPLFAAATCLITPHIAWSTAEARRRLMAVAAENLRAFLAGRAINVVHAY